MPFFHLSGENNIMKQTLDESQQEIFIVHADTLEVIYLNRRALQMRSPDCLGLPISITRIGSEYNLKSFKSMVQPLMDGSQKEINLLVHHQDKERRNYPVEVRITHHAMQGLEYLLFMATNILEKVQFEKELKQKNEALKKLGFELDKFIYSASNDLLAPISTLKGLLNLQDKERNSVAKPNYQSMMDKTVTRMERYIHDMIDFSKNMRMEVDVSPLEMKNLLSFTLENMINIEGFSNITIHYEIDQQCPFFSDEERIKVLLSNLVSNAIIYQNPKGRTPFLCISILVESKKVVLKFRDNGIGIGKESIEHIFEMFYCASTSSNGSGLGLYTVREIIKKLRGKIQVASVLGEGTEFFIEIPNKTPKESVHKRVNQVKTIKNAF